MPKLFPKEIKFNSKNEEPELESYIVKMKFGKDDKIDIKELQSKIYKILEINQNLINVVSVTENKDGKEATILIHAYDEINFKKLKEFNIIKSDKIKKSPYSWWLYNKTSTNPFIYLCPTKEYAQLVLNYDFEKFIDGYVLEPADEISDYLYVMSDPIFLQAKIYVNKPEIKEIKPKEESNNRNVLMIFFDQFNSWHRLPQFFTDQLKGYQAFKKIGLEFTQHHNNRQMCGPSRSVYMTGTINTGIVDNIDQPYQYDAIPNLDGDKNTAGRMFKNAGYDITAYYGKSHFDSRMAPGEFYNPRMNIATTGAMKSIGFDRHGELEDDFYEEKHAYVSDDRTFEKKSIAGTVDEEVYDVEVNGVKYQGMLPFLKARVLDKKSFHAQFHFTNPHDIMHYYHNNSQTGTADLMQFAYPFYNEQIKEFGTSVFQYSDEFLEAFSKNSFFQENFFEDNYEDYKNNAESLLYYESFINDFVTDPKYNSIYPFMLGCWEGLKVQFTIGKQKEIVLWKNFQNTYLQMIKHVDNYMYQLFEYLSSTDLLKNTAVVITADHGEECGAHGMKQKGFHYENSMNVPLLIYSPDMDKSLINTKTDRLVSSIDINPTMATLGLIENPNLTSFVGNSIFKNENGKLILSDNSNEKVIAILNNWMYYYCYATYYKAYEMLPEANKEIVLNPLQNPLDFLFMANVMKIKLNGKTYKYCIWWSPITIIKNQYSDVKLKDFNKKFSLKIFHEPLLELLEDYILTIPSLIEKFTEILDDDEQTMFEVALRINEFKNDNFKAFFSTYLLSAVACYESSNSKEELINNLKNKRSVSINLKTPYLDLSYEDFKSDFDDGYFLEMLYDLDEDPNELYNLMDPRVSSNLDNKTKVKNQLIAKELYHDMISELYNKSIDKAITPIINTIAMNFLTYLKQNISNNKGSEIDKLSDDDILFYITMYGNNNFDNPGIEETMLRKIRNIRF